MSITEIEDNDLDLDEVFEVPEPVDEPQAVEAEEIDEEVDSPTSKEEEHGPYKDHNALLLADESTQRKYTRRTTEEEQSNMAKEMVMLDMEIDAIKEAHKQAGIEAKKKIKGFTGRINEIKGSIKSGHIEVDDVVHMFRDYRRFMVTEYDSQGHRIRVRQMRPSEHQTRIV